MKDHENGMTEAVFVIRRRFVTASINMLHYCKTSAKCTFTVCGANRPLSRSLNKRKLPKSESGIRIYYNRKMSLSREGTVPQITFNRESCASERADHVAVRLEHYIRVFGGIGHKHFDDQELQRNRIWMFNLFTEKWSMYMVRRKIPPAINAACAVAIGSDVYMFDGRRNAECSFADALWKLNRNPKGYFLWSRIVTEDQTRVPSVRSKHTGWQYGGNLWIFGGHTESSDGYLNDNGDFDNGWCNHLFSFSPSSKEWRNPKCSGSVPAPRSSHDSTRIGGKVWLFGGTNVTLQFNDFHELDMRSLVWTEIQTGEPKPQMRDICSLNAISDKRLVLHGGATLDGALQQFESTWIMDLSSYTWEQYTTDTDHGRCAHTGTTVRQVLTVI